MTNDQIDEFVSRYIGEIQDTTSEGMSEWSALESLTGSEPDTAWRVITRLVMESPDVYVHQIGAGPLETLLSDHPDFFERAVKLAERETRFREALRYVRDVEIPAEWREAYDELWRGERNQ